MHVHIIIYIYIYIYMDTHTLLYLQFYLQSVSHNRINMPDLIYPHSLDIHAVEQRVLSYVEFTSIFHFGHGIKNKYTSSLWQNDTQTL